MIADAHAVGGHDLPHVNARFISGNRLIHVEIDADRVAVEGAGAEPFVQGFPLVRCIGEATALQLAVIIGKTAREVEQADALDYAAGYTCFMDGSVRDYQLDRTITQGKNFVRSSAMGPHLVTPDEVGELSELSLTTRVSGEIMQQTTLDNMIFPVAELISYVSRICQLNPGDVIATGTPEGVGFKRTPPRFLVPGDTVEVAIDRVGTLSNTVGAAPDA